MPDRRFPPPWSVEDPDMKHGQDYYIVHDATGHTMITLWACRPCVEAHGLTGRFARSPAETRRHE
jgi:hypothetical protein